MIAQCPNETFEVMLWEYRGPGPPQKLGFYVEKSSKHCLTKGPLTDLDYRKLQCLGRT